MLVIAAGATPARAQDRADWLTKAERTGFRETGDYEDTRAYAQRLAEDSPWIELLSFGTSPQGRDLMLLVASKDGAFTPEAARAAGKPVILVQNAIHAGEIEGKDASLMLLRDVAITREREDLLDGATLLVMPLFNVDGYARFGPYTRINQNGPAESGWRTTAQTYNLNRDYMKADSPEMQAWLRVFDDWQPHLLIDNHTTDGADYQYVMTYQLGTRADMPPSIAAWSRDVYLPALTQHVEAAGYPVGPYLDLKDPLDPAKGFQGVHDTGRYSTGYVPLRNRPALLVETHMLKAYEPRLRSTYETIVGTLELVRRDPDGLVAAVREAEEWSARITSANGDSIPLSFELSDSASTPLDYRGISWQHEPSEISGAMRVIYGEEPIEMDVAFYGELVPQHFVRPPAAYLIPVEWAAIAEKLRLHGIPVERLDEPVIGEFEVSRFSDVSWADGPFEGHHLVDSLEASGAVATDTLPAGSFRVPLGNATGRLAMQLLEPLAPD
ncbi:MAG TPA: M14 family metallopeptidase, partial [Gemmatimonadota bacterium]